MSDESSEANAEEKLGGRRSCGCDGAGGFHCTDVRGSLRVEELRCARSFYRCRDKLPSWQWAPFGWNQCSGQESLRRTRVASGNPKFDKERRAICPKIGVASCSDYSFRTSAAFLFGKRKRIMFELA